MVIGIDPGATGAVVCLKNGHLVCRRFDGGSPLELIGELLTPGARVALEAVHAMPGQGVVSMFTFGKGYGEIIGYLKAFKVDLTLYSPQAWTKLLPEGDTPKNRVKAFCEAKWGLDRFIYPGCRVPHQGSMDAACIAEYHRLVLEGAIAAPVVGRKRKSLRPMKLG